MSGEQASQVEVAPLTSLVPDPDNARLHPDDNLDAIARSLARHGQPEALLVRRRDGMVIAGNGRLRAMQRLGWKKAEVRYVDWDDGRCRAYAIAANRTAELAAWDLGALERQLDGLDANFDLADLGFDEAALDKLFGEDRGDHGEVDEDEAPEPPDAPVSRPGDLWTIGRHRVLCGDSCAEADVARVLGGRKADAVLTDPPYGVSYVGKGKRRKTIQNDGAAGLPALLAASLGLAAKHTRPGAVWYVAGPTGPMMLHFCQALTDLEVWRQTLVWVKDALVLGRSDFHYRHEVIFYGWTPGGAHTPPADRKQDSIWEFPRPKQSEDHPTMKPVALYARMLEHSTREGELVFEPFGGSGTTLVACEKMGRTGCAIELDPAYVDVIVRRLETVTGLKAAREKAEESA